MTPQNLICDIRENSDEITPTSSTHPTTRKQNKKSSTNDNDFNSELLFTKDFFGIRSKILVWKLKD